MNVSVVFSIQFMIWSCQVLIFANLFHELITTICFIEGKNWNTTKSNGNLSNICIHIFAWLVGQWNRESSLLSLFVIYFYSLTTSLTFLFASANGSTHAQLPLRQKLSFCKCLSHTFNSNYVYMAGFLISNCL